MPPMTFAGLSGFPPHQNFKQALLDLYPKSPEPQAEAV
jgi:hypothetical protein